MKIKAASQKFFLDLALDKAGDSPDSHQKVGCVIAKDNQVLAMGHNDTPYGVEHTPERLSRPAKYSWVEHAERKAIYQAARRGISLRGATMYLTLAPCTDCARAIVEAGITGLVCPEPDYDHPRWGENQAIAIEILDEGGVVTQLIKIEEQAHECQTCKGSVCSL